MKKMFAIVALALLSASAFAQNSAYYKIKDFAEKQRIHEADSMMAAALANPKTTKLAQFYNLAGQIKVELLKPELNAAAMGMPFDTVKFCQYIDAAVDYYTKSHVADISPNAKGKVDPQYIAANHFAILSMIDYYNYAGVFQNASGNYQKSIEYFQKYLDFPKNPVFSASESDSLYAAKHTAYAQTAVNLVMLNYQMKNWDGVLSTVDVALQDTISLHDLYLLKMQAYLEKGDSAAYRGVLQEAVGRTNNANFAQNLLYYYYETNQAEEGYKMASDLVAKHPESKGAWYMLGCVELNLKKEYENSRRSFQKALDMDPDYVEANANMAYSYINEIVAKRHNGEFKIIGTGVGITSKNKAAYEKELAVVKDYYSKAKPYMEKVQALRPDSPRDWAGALQQIYSNLGDKAKADEMDAILDASNHR